jgi:MoxR-like ATPase
MEEKKMTITALEKLQMIALELKDYAIEREDEVDTAVCALLSGQHVLLLGAPGLAKSMLARELCRRVEGASYFEYLLSKYTTDKDLFVAVTNIEERESQNGGKSVKFVPDVTGMLPEAHIAFLDEIFKANSATLNALLTLINERKFHIQGKPVTCPLISMFGASNEMPEAEEGLDALYDRFMVRFVVERVKERGNRIRMRQQSRARRAKQSAGALNPTTLTLAELLDLQKQVYQVQVPQVIDERVEELIEKLLAEGIIISDRRDVRIDPLIQAHALMEGRNQVNETDLTILQYCFWSQPSEIKTVQRVVLSISNPMENKAIELLDQATEIRDNAVQAANGSAGAEANSKLKKLVVAIDELIQQAQAQGAPTTKIVEAKAKIQGFNKEVVKVCLGLDI